MDKNDKSYEYALILDKYYDDSLIEQTNPLVLEAIHFFEEKAKENMGIGMLNAYYIFTKDNQSTWEEYSRIENMIREYIAIYSARNHKNISDYTLEFINYGRTELVYVLTDKTTNDKITILAKQPIVPFGKVKQEADYLIDLKKKDKNVIAPIDYFSYLNQEMYVTPYVNQARCIASDEKWGMYVPEPYYRFVDFTNRQEEIVNTCMIAKLISFYDTENQEGIAACKIGGGDFMLPKGWEEIEATLTNTLNSLYFIACREKIKCSLDEYISIIKKEFSSRTIEREDNVIINHRGRVPMNITHINNGIELGLSLLNEQEGGKEYND